MLKTNLNHIESELIEEIDLFPNAKDLEIKHNFNDGGDRVVNTVTFLGNTYAYGNLMDKTASELVRKRLIKRYAKLSIYKALSKHFNANLAWGSLTGIRPTRLAYSEMDKDGNFEDFFINTMKVSKEKTLLTKKVILSQKGIYELDKDNADFFVFIPFCPSRCKYCSFISADIRGAESLVDDYVDALIYEIESSARFIKKLRSIYVGGGTPVALSDQNLIKVLKAVSKLNSGVEFTVEAGRPDRITKENLQILEDYGVTRICINPQTFDDETLKRIGRNHTGQDAIDKFLLAKDRFVTNMDFIAGLDGESRDTFEKGIEKASNLAPDNITVHTLCIKRGSCLAEKTKRLDATDIDKMVQTSQTILEEKGYSPYYLYRQKYMAGNLENVGYAKPNKACVYNIDTMEEISSTVACGAGAISKRVVLGENRIERVPSPKDVKTYLGKVKELIDCKTKLFSE